MTENLTIFTAGVAKSMSDKAAAQWSAAHPELPCRVVSGGSVALIRRLKAGEPCDMLVSADDAIIASMLIPEYAEDYTVFAGNRMVVTSLHGKEISSADWRERLLAPDTVFGYSEPTLDPGGYRAVMAILLADNVEQGLTDKLMHHPGRRVLADAADTDADYKIYYYTKALAGGKPFAELPAEMNLSEPALNALYAKAQVELGDGVVAGSAVNHALTIPKAAPHPEAARQFAQLFLSLDFGEEGFLPR